MCSSLPESEKLSRLLLKTEHVEIIDRLVTEIQSNGNYDTSPLYELDRSFDFLLNDDTAMDKITEGYPYHHENTIYTPLQYAREEIEICNINYTGAYVVKYSFMHLEAAARYFLKNNYPLRRFFLSNISLESSLKNLTSLNTLPENIIEGYKIFISLHNKSLKDIDENRSSAFITSPKDALISYFSARIIGLTTLKYSHAKEAIHYMRKSDNPYFKYYIL